MTLLEGTFTRKEKIECGHWRLWKDTSFLFGWDWNPAHKPHREDPLGQRNMLKIHFGRYIFFAWWAA